jgi:hypothetical protein
MVFNTLSGRPFNAVCRVVIHHFAVIGERLGCTDGARFFVSSSSPLVGLVARVRSLRRGLLFCE